MIFMFGLRRLALMAGLAGAMTLAVAVPASSAVCQYGTSSDFVALQADVYTSTACVGPVSGNDNEASVAGLFGVQSWLKDTRYDVGTGFESGANLMTSVTSSDNFLSGTWSVSSWSGITDAILVLKSATDYAAYKLDLTAGTSGGWQTLPFLNRNDKQQQLSHITLYTNVAQVPLPAAGVLMLGALGGLAALRRRRKAA